jgi:hypothetical protein
LGAILVVAILLLSTATAGALAAAGRPTSGGSAPAASSAGTPLLTAPHPLGGNNSTPVDQVAGTFYGSNSSWAVADLNHLQCDNYTFWENDSPYEYFAENETECLAGPQDPAIVNLGGDAVGVGYSFLSNYTATAACPDSQRLADSGVAFQVSNDSGVEWNAPVLIGNSTCSYDNAFSPSFAVGAGTIYGAFIESNNTTGGHYNYSYISPTFSYWENSSYPPYPQGDNNASGDAIGFVTSRDNGTSFSNTTTLAIAGITNVSDPKVAAFGDTVYVVYVQVANLTNMTLGSTQTYGVTNYPMSVKIIESTDGGVLWNGPYTLPGLNGTDDWTAMSPSVAVNATGELAVSYATNRTCIYYFSFCYDYGDSIVVSTSLTNGTTWSTPSTVTQVAGESACWYDLIAPPYGCTPTPWNWGPVSSIAFDPNHPATVYVVWTDGYYTWNPAPANETSGPSSTDIGFGTAVFDAVSTNNAGTWTTAIVEEPTSSTAYDYDYAEDPAVTVAASGLVYVSFAWINETYCPTCQQAFTEHTSFWLADSTDGLTRSWNAYPAAVSSAYEYSQIEDWCGTLSAVTTIASKPVAIYTEGLEGTGTFHYQYGTYNGLPLYHYWYNDTYPTELISAYSTQQAPLTVNFTETGLPAATTWELSLSGNTYTTNLTTVQVTDIPAGTTIYIYTPPVTIPGHGWEQYIATTSVGASWAFYADMNVSVNFQLYYGVGFYFPSTIVPGPSSFSYIYFDMDFDSGGNFYYFDYYYEVVGTTVYTGTYYSEPLPWYFPNGTIITLANTYYSDLPVSYVYGVGNGSYTGVPSAGTVTVNGPINETFFGGIISTYNLTFSPVGLPSGTPYTFDFAGTVYNATAPASVIVMNVRTGQYSLSGVSASGGGGWVYYAPSAGSEINVPVQVDILLNFSTEVDTASTPGPVTFHANGLTAGDYWQVTFNGTTYGSSTPNITLTVHKGTYPVAALPVADSLNDSYAYTPTAFGPSLTVASGATYDVNYTLAYRVSVSATVGGNVPGAGSRWATPGSTESYTATPAANYNFQGWTGTGTGSYSGSSTTASITVNSPISETAHFTPLPGNRFNLTVSESGLPAGTWWTVDLNGTGYSSDAGTLLITSLLSCGAGASGNYPISVPYVYPNGTLGTRYVATGFPGSTCTTGTTTLSITFHAEYLVTPYSNGNGTASLTIGGLTVNAGAWVAEGDSVSLSEHADTGYTFSGWLGTGSGSYSGTTGSQVVTPAGPVTELASFAPTVIIPPARYWVHFELETPLVAGTAWSVAFNGTTYTSTTGWINLTGFLAGPYVEHAASVYSPDRSVEYTLKTTLTTPLELSGNQTIEVGYGASYWVTLEATAGGSISPTSSAYYASGAQLSLGATPNSGYQFEGWVGTGTGAYTGTNPSGTATVSGPITEVATFGAPSVTPSTSSPTFLTSTAGIATLAAVGLAVGLIAGLVVFRRPRGGAGGPPPQAWDEGANP